MQLLRPGGVRLFISSNKWYRAAYGEKAPRHLATITTLLHAIDFGDAPVFTAIAYPTIVIARKAAPTANHAFRSLNWDSATPSSEITNFAAFYAGKSSRVAQSSLSPGGWRFITRKGQDLLEKIRAAGTPLGQFVKERFYRGVLTGLNEAFVVDRATRDRLIAEDSDSRDILKPFLRGRDVKRWRIEHEDMWLIRIESSENKQHPWTGKKEKEAERVFAATYPAIYKHLNPFRDKLIRRDDQGKYFWELRSCAYWDQFDAPGVIYPDVLIPQYAYADAARYATVRCTSSPTPKCTLLAF